MHAALYLFLSLPAFVTVVLLTLPRRQRKARGIQSAAVERFAVLDTAVESRAMRGWRAGLLLTLIPMLGSAALLKLRWRTIPERFPIHWGIHGEPNGWANRTPGSVFGMLLLAALLVAMIAGLGELAMRSSPGFRGRSEMLRTVRGILLAVSWFLTLMLCGISLLPLARDSSNIVPLLFVSVIVFSLIILLYAGVRSLSMADTIAASQNATDDRFWKAGLFYINPGDSALMVPKRYGFGYTLNFGRPISWLIIGGILLLPLILSAVLYLGKRH